MGPLHSSSAAGRGQPRRGSGRSSLSRWLSSRAQEDAGQNAQDQGGHTESATGDPASHELFTRTEGSEVSQYPAINLFKESSRQVAWVFGTTTTRGRTGSTDRVRPK